MKKYTLCTESFTLQLDVQKYDEKREAYINSLLTVTVECDNFKASTVMEAAWQDIVDFSKNIYHLYRTLNGNAVIREMYSDHNFVKFSVDDLGHISVEGNIYNFDNCHKKELYFETEFDQTYLKNFAEQMYNEFVKGK